MNYILFTNIIIIEKLDHDPFLAKVSVLDKHISMTDQKILNLCLNR